MILNKKQYESLNKILNEISLKIRDLQQDNRNSWEKKSEEDKTSMNRGIFIGKQSALEECYNLFRSKADFSYNSEKKAFDIQISNIKNVIEIQIKAIEKLLEENKIEEVKDQLKLMEANCKQIEIILNSLK